MVAQDRRYCFTWNNYTPADLELIQSKLSLFSYLVYGKETGDSGTPHLQGFFIIKGNKKSIIQLKRLFGDQPSFQAARALSATAAAYCKKGVQSHEEWDESGISGPTYGLDADVFEHGHLRGAGGSPNSLSEMAESIKSGVPMTDVSEMDPSTYIRNYRGLAAYANLQTTDYEHNTVRGIWIIGKPGTGKSHHARKFGELMGGYFVKSQSKWFDGYNGEPVIILEDFDIDGQFLGHEMKLWSDKYSHTAEIKGGSVKLRHKFFVVTTNFHMGEIWPEDSPRIDRPQKDYSKIHQALSRRFFVIDMPQDENENAERIPQLDEILSMYGIDGSTGD